MPGTEVSANTGGVRNALDSNRSHHAAIDVLHYMTMKWKRAHDSWIAKIHPQDQAGILAKSIPRGQINRVPRGRLLPSHSSSANNDEVQLVDMKNVRFARPVFDCPILYVSLMHGDRRFGAVWVKHSGLVAFLSDKEKCCAVGIRRINQPF